MSELTCAAIDLGKTSQGIYSIFATATLRPNSKYNVAVCLHNAVCPTQIKITLKGCSYEDTTTVEMQPMTVQNIEFNTPPLCEGEYELTAEGIKGLIFHERKQLKFKAFKPVILIQTDKAVYKQADLLRFRVLFMNENTQPVTVEKPICISLHDDKTKLQKQWKNVAHKNGVFLGKYELPAQPAYGKWLIRVCDEDGLLTSKSFHVDKYVLPKFELALETESDVVQSVGAINATVRAKDFKGKATVSIVPKYGRDKGIVLAEKMIDIDGKGEVQFPISDEMTRRDERTFEIIAEIKESLFGDKVSIATAVTLHKQRFVFECVPHTSGEPCKFQIAIKHVDGSAVLDNKNAVKLMIEKLLGNKIYENKNLSQYLDEHGIATFEANLLADSETYYYLNFEYLDCKEGFICSPVMFEDKSFETIKGLELEVLTKRPHLGHPIEFRLKSTLAIPYCIYMIVARGKILRAEFVVWPVGAESLAIKFETTLDMVNTVFLFVHYVVSSKLHCTKTTIKLENKLENVISLSAPAEARIGENIELEVKSKPNSYVGLLATNQKNYNHLSLYDIFMKLTSFECRAEEQENMHLWSGGVVLTNASEIEWAESHNGLSSFHIEPDKVIYLDMLSNDWRTRKPIHRRRNYKEFPENWLFEDIENLTDETISVRKTMPDMPTSWYITGFSLNAESGLGLTERSLTVNTFRSFFISTKLPYTLKKGEEFSVPVLVFNYMNQDISAKVTIHNESNEFSFQEPDKYAKKRVKILSLPKNSRGCVNFHICATNIGQITIKVTAHCTLAGDALLRMLKVVPEGMTVFKSEDFQLLAAEGEACLKQLTKELEIPENAVPESVFVEATLVGNIFGLNSLKLKRLVRKPCGDGEQNMIDFVANMSVLRYLECTNETNADIAQEAKQFLETAYQRELSYKHDDGSYSALGKSEATGSTWLTAYVVHSYQKAKKYINIDPQLLDDGFNFLAKLQAPNGCFSEVGKVLDHALVHEFSLTAFVLLAFLESTEFEAKYAENIDRGFEYLRQNIKAIKESYALAIALYAFQKRKIEIVSELLAMFQLWAINDCGLKWWAKERSADDENWRTCSADIEITAYVMLTLLETDISTLPIAKWLTSQFNNYDDLRAIQATTLSLEALLGFAEKYCTAANSNLKVDIFTTTTAKTFNINENNFLKKQTWELPKESRQIVCSAYGTGNCFIQISYRYNILEQLQKASTTFKVSTPFKSKVQHKSMSMNVCVELAPSKLEGANCMSNMAVMEISLPSGYLAMPEMLEKIIKLKNVKHVETQDSDTRIVLYFDDIKSIEKLCIPVEAKLVHGAFNRKSVPIVIYDFYNRQNRVHHFYKIRESLDDLDVDHLQAPSVVEYQNGFNKMLQYFTNLFRRK